MRLRVGSHAGMDALFLELWHHVTGDFWQTVGSRHLAILQSMIHNLMNAKLESLYQRLHSDIQSLRQEPPRSY